MSWRKMLLDESSYGVCPRCGKETGEVQTPASGMSYYGHDTGFWAGLLGTGC